MPDPSGLNGDAMGPETDACPECGARVPTGGSCLEHFHALLALEWEIPGGPGEVAHFYAVATYGIQHPALMGYTEATRDGLLKAVRDKLSGASMDAIRHQVRARASGAGRVTRRGDDPVPAKGVDTWPMIVTDVIAGGTDGYPERTEQWARSVVEALEALA